MANPSSLNQAPTLKVIAIDDEYLALQLIENYIAQIPGLELVGKYKSPLLALDRLQQGDIDLLFLDIQMPSLKGTQFLRSLQRPPATIFTTAYADYAVEAFDLQAVDYLLKPFPLERFLQAVNKAKQWRNQQTTATTPPPVSTPETHLTVKVDGKIVRVLLQDILYIEGLKEYVRIVCPNQRYVTLASLKSLEDELPASQFLRVHKSYIVAKDKVQALEGNRLEIGEDKIPISRGKREEIVHLIFYP